MIWENTWTADDHDDEEMFYGPGGRFAGNSCQAGEWSNS